MTKLQTLIEMHQFCRPMGSVTEQAFIDVYIRPLPNAERDMFGNWHVTVSDAPILWSSHLDTVHYKEGYQDVRYHRKSGLLMLGKKSESNCLGADCTAGVFLMREMILAKVPGHYVFHYGEEMGCVGSSLLAKNHAKFLAQFKFAVALDRGGSTDVITHQASGRTASDAFAKSLAKQLGGYYAPNDGGIYTDTNEYAGIIAECSNVSVGYSRQHSTAETLDTKHLFKLLAKLKKIKVKDLVVDRKPGEFEDEDDYFNYRYYSMRDRSSHTLTDSPILRDVADVFYDAKSNKWIGIYDDGRDYVQQEFDSFDQAEAWLYGHDESLPIPSLSKDGDFCVASDSTNEDAKLYCYLDKDYADIQRALKVQAQILPFTKMGNLTQKPS